jgi:hypothetical protein
MAVQQQIHHFQGGQDGLTITWDLYRGKRASNDHFYLVGTRVKVYDQEPTKGELAEITDRHVIADRIVETVARYNRHTRTLTVTLEKEYNDLHAAEVDFMIFVSDAVGVKNTL